MKLWVEDEDIERISTKARLDVSNIIIKRTLADALETIESDYNKFDLVTLDIKIDALGDERIVHKHLHSIVPRIWKISKEDLKQKAGFFLLLQLLHKGFPKERICFLTGNTSTSFDDPSLDLLEYMETNNFTSNYLTLKENQLDFIYNLLQRMLEEASCDSDIIKEIWENIQGGQCAEALTILSDILGDTKMDKANVYDQELHHFEKANIRIPKAFKKNDEGYNKYHRWQQEKETDYYILRSGILGILEEVKHQLVNQGKSYIKFYDYVHPSHWHAYSVDYFNDLLGNIARLFPQREPVKKWIYTQLVRNLSHDWENVRIRRNYLYLSDNNPEINKNIETIKNRAYFKIMRLTRNWTAHSKMLDFQPYQVAFLFIVAMRSLFHMENTVLPSERILLDFLIQPNVGIRKHNTANNIRDFLKASEDNFLTIRALKNKNDISKDFYNNLYTIFNDIGNSQDKCSVDYLIRLLWHAMDYQSSSDQTSLLGVILAKDTDIINVLLNNTFEILYKIDRENN